MVKQFTRRALFELTVATLLAHSFTTTASAQEPLNDLELKIKNQIALGYKLEASEFAYTSSGILAGCDPLENPSKLIAEIINSNEKIGNQEYKALKLEGEIAGLEENIFKITEKKKVRVPLSDLPAKPTPNEIYSFLDEALNNMAREWAQEYGLDTRFRQAIESPKYSITKNCNFS